jgi:hypothetical protein
MNRPDGEGEKPKSGRSQTAVGLADVDADAIAQWAPASSVHNVPYWYGCTRELYDQAALATYIPGVWQTHLRS